MHLEYDHAIRKMCSLNTPRTPHFAGQVELFAPNERENKIKTKEKSPKFWAFSMVAGEIFVRYTEEHFPLLLGREVRLFL